MNANGILETVHKVMKEYETKYGQRDYYKVCVELAKHFVANYEYTEPGSKEELPIDKSIDMMIDFYQEISPEYLTTINNIIEAGEFKTYSVEEAKDKNVDNALNKDIVEIVYNNTIDDTVTAIHEMGHKLSSPKYVDKRVVNTNEYDSFRRQDIRNNYYSEIPSIVMEMSSYNYLEQKGIPTEEIKKARLFILNGTYDMCVSMLVMEAAKDLTLLKLGANEVTYELLEQIEDEPPFSEEEFNEYLISNYGQTFFDYYQRSTIKEDFMSDQGLLNYDQMKSYILGFYVGALYNNTPELKEQLNTLLNYFKDKSTNVDIGKQLQLPFESNNIEQLKTAMHLEIQKTNQTSYQM